MSEVSNKTIVGLLAVALVITVVGTVMSVSKLSELSGMSSGVTGAATSSGTSTVTISAFTSLTSIDSAIAFGSGYVNSTVNYGGTTDAWPCVMDSDGKHNQSGRSCVGFANVLEGFLLENTGNVNVSVNFTCSGSCDAATFIGGTNPKFQFKVQPNVDAGQTTEQGSADTGDSCLGNTGSQVFTVNKNGWNFSNHTAGSWTGSDAAHNEGVYLGMTGSSRTSGYICGNSTAFPLEATNARDAGVFDINISIPTDTVKGSAKTATFTFTATGSAS